MKPSVLETHDLNKMICLDYKIDEENLTFYAGIKNLKIIFNLFINIAFSSL